MQYGNDVAISVNSVQAVLDSLIFAQTKPLAMSLQNLFVVEKAVADRSTPRGDEDRLYIIQSILINVISSNIKQLRAQLSRHFAFGDNIHQATKALSQDMVSDSHWHMAWSILYYLYVEVNLDLTIDKIADIANLDAKTIRRYRNRGVKFLTQNLWQLEKQARQAFRHDRILARLSPINWDAYYGYLEETQSIMDGIETNKFRTILVAGYTGSGKTTFLKHIVRQLVLQEMIDDILWIRSPKTIEEVVSSIERYFSTEFNFDISNIFSVFRCAIVIDNADIAIQSPQWDEIVYKTSGSYLLTSISSLDTINDTSSQAFIALKNLEHSVVKQLIHDHFPDEVLNSDEVMKHTCGNPRKIWQFLNVRRYHRAQFRDNINNFDKTVDYLLAHRQFRVTCSLIPSQGIANDSLFEIDPQFHANLALMRNFGIVEYQNSHVMISDDVRLAIEGKITQAEFTTAIKKIHSNLGKIHDAVILIEHIIWHFEQWVPDDWRYLWIKEYWKTGLSHGESRVWHSLLLKYSQLFNESWIKIAVAVSYRLQSQFTLSRQLLEEVLILAGQNGDFCALAVSTLEYAKVLRLQSKFQLAVLQVEKLERSLVQYLPIDSHVDYIKERAQLALDRQLHEVTLEILTAIDDPEAKMMQAEALYRLRKYEDCMDICYSILTNSGTSHSIRGHILNIIGRCYQQLHQHEMAVEQFSLALEKYREQPSLLQVCRVKINMAVSLIHLEEFEPAMGDLAYAKKIATEINDTVALKTILHNENYVHSIIASRY